MIAVIQLEDISAVPSSWLVKAFPAVMYILGIEQTIEFCIANNWTKVFLSYFIIVQYLNNGIQQYSKTIHEMLLPLNNATITIYILLDITS